MYIRLVQEMSNSKEFFFQATLKKSLFSVQRVAEIIATRAAAKSSVFFTSFMFCLGGGEEVRK